MRVDGRAWTPAELGAVPSDDTWVQWAVTLELAPGPHTLAVRATDKSGYTQTGARRDVVPDGRHRLALDRGQGRPDGSARRSRATLWPCATPW